MDTRCSGDGKMKSKNYLWKKGLIKICTIVSHRFADDSMLIKCNLRISGLVFSFLKYLQKSYQEKQHCQYSSTTRRNYI